MLRDGEDEGLVDVVADLPADAQAAEPVQQRDRQPLPGCRTLLPCQGSRRDRYPWLPGLRANAHWRMVAAARRHELIC